MCGIFGVATVRGRSVGLSDAAACALRDRLAHRGPDGAGLWRSGTEGRADHVLLAHRRLAVIDRSPAAAQPMVRAAPDGSLSVLSYNGELYNDAELRASLAELGYRFHTTSDTETVLAALTHWGVEAIPRLRGMFALAWFDAQTQTLLLARDPLGIKPLYYTPTRSNTPIVFASEPHAILAHPGVSVQPDPITTSAYLTTIRTTLGDRTLFEGVRVVLPGQILLFDLGGEQAQMKTLDADWFQTAPDTWFNGPEAEEAVATVITDSVLRHLRADVPACSLLSGGLDSSIVLACLLGAPNPGSHRPRTYCSGHDNASPDSDFAHARRVAAHLGSDHTEAPVTRELFAERWPAMVSAMGLPLSTPNEVAINHVAKRLRADDQIVALSGEGADELFGGYDLPLEQARDWEFDRSNSIAPWVSDPGVFQLLSAAWIRPGDKPQILSPSIWRSADQDAHLGSVYSDQFAQLRRSTDDSPLAAHLRFHRRVNLVGLLQRLDTATMLEGVEGRTPLADILVARLAEALPTDMKFSQPTSPGAAWGTKLVLRRAFARRLPPDVVARPKASFPLPIQEWVADQTTVLSRSAFARDLFTPAAIAHVVQNPARLWNLAWPMLNLALWGERWWGSGSENFTDRSNATRATPEPLAEPKRRPAAASASGSS